MSLQPQEHMHGLRRDNCLPTPLTAFLDLPFEIREHIYMDALVVDQVQVSDWNYNYPNHGYKDWRHSKCTHCRCVHGANINLLLTCKTIAAEGTRIFYGHNDFAFTGHHAYKEEVDWLNTIGPVNRGHLTRMSIGIRQPSPAWQLPDGTREGMEPDDFIKFNTFNARHPLLVKPDTSWGGKVSDEWQEGEVHDIDPDLEAIFSLLGSVQNRCQHPIHLLLLHDGWGFPGIPGKYADDDEYLIPYFPTDLPNLVEAWRAIYSVNRAIDVTWRDYPAEGTADEHLNAFANAGWVLIDQILRKDGKVDYFDLKRVRYVLRSSIKADQPTYDDEHGQRPAVEMADAGCYGLWSCPNRTIHRDGDLCVCTDKGLSALNTSLARHRPVWPKMPAPGLVEY